MSVFCLKRMNTWVMPGKLTLVTWSIPRTVPSSSSIGIVIFSSTSRGGASCHGTRIVNIDPTKPAGSISAGIPSVAIVPITAIVSASINTAMRRSSENFGSAGSDS